MIENSIFIISASRGIGAATTILAAEHDYAVVVKYKKNKEAAENLVTEIIYLLLFLEEFL